MAGSAEGKGPGSAPAVEDVKTEQQVEAGLDRKEAEAAADKGQRPGAGTADSPKRQGDKLEHATKAAAGKPGGS